MEDSNINKYKKLLKNNGFELFNNTVSLRSFMRLLGKKRMSEYDIDMFATRNLGGTIANPSPFKCAEETIVIEDGIYTISNDNIIYSDDEIPVDLNNYLCSKLYDFIPVFEKGVLIDIFVNYRAIKYLIIKFGVELKNDNLVNVSDELLLEEEEMLNKKFHGSFRPIREKLTDAKKCVLTFFKKVKYKLYHIWKIIYNSPSVNQFSFYNIEKINQKLLFYAR